MIPSRILFLSEFSPFRTYSGAHQRSNLICTALAKIAHVDILSAEQDQECTIDNCSIIKTEVYAQRKNKYTLVLSRLLLLLVPPLIPKIINTFLMLTIDVLGKRNRYLSSIARNILKTNRYEFVFVRHINSLRMFGIKPSRKIILDIDDLPELRYSSKYNTLKNRKTINSLYHKAFYFFCIKTSRIFTKRIIKKVFVAYLPNRQQCLHSPNTVFLPNIPYIQTNILKKTAKHQIMFVGVIDYEPNFIGVEYFLENIYPLVIREISDVNFNIIGKISDERKKKWLQKYKNISIKGIVDDLNQEYKTSSIIVVPVYQGSGTNIKVLEAMSQKKACVISPFAGKGFEDLLKNGENILLADNDFDFSHKIIKLLTDSDYRETVEQKAKDDIDKLYSFEYFSSIIEKSINTAIEDNLLAGINIS